jgi:hypothetical protein
MCTVHSVEEGARELKLIIYDWNLTQEYDLIGQVGKRPQPCPC